MQGPSQNLIAFPRQIALGVKALKTSRLSNYRKVFSLMGKTEKIIFRILILFALVSFTVSLGNFYLQNTQLGPSLGGQYTEGILGRPQYINPILAVTDADLSLNKLVFSGLYKFDAAGELVPDLAESLPQISEDQKTYTVKLKPNGFWHDRKQVTAEDVVFTVNAIKNPGFKSPLRAFWTNTTAEKTSDLEIKFTTKEVAGPFIYNLTIPLLPHHLWENTDPENFLLSTLNLEAVGNGPYAISQINKLPSGKIQSIVLASFSGYHNSQANLETVILRFYDEEEELINALRGGELDGAAIVPNTDTELSTLGEKFSLYRTPIAQYQIAFFNLTHSLMSEKAVRQALVLSANPSSILNRIYNNQRRLPQDPLSGQALINQTNFSEAEKILDQAGWKLESDGKRHKKNQVLEFSLAAGNSPSASGTARQLAESWGNLGINVNLNILPSKNLTDEFIKPRNFDVLIFSQKYGADPDPFFFWHSSQTKDPGLNLTGLSDTALDKILTESRTTTQKADRLQKYQLISQTLAQAFPQILLNQSEMFYLVNKKIQNVTLGNINEPTQRFYDLPNWYIETARKWK